MPGPADSCAICGAGPLQPAGHYRRCPACGHELSALARQGYIVNDQLDPAQIRRRDGLERWKRAVVARARLQGELLVDVGSGSGKFLLHSRDLFARHLGVEITPSCLRFSREVLGLEVVDDIQGLRERPSVVTFWHSLEHFPLEPMHRVLERLRALAGPDTRVVVSVPNGRSLQRRAFGAGYAYDDPENHVHQFSPRSLDQLMARHGFDRQGTRFGLAYAVFGYLQGLLNLAMPARLHDYLYYRRKRGQDFGLSTGALRALDATNLLLAGLCLPAALGLSLVDLAVPHLAGVITAVYRPVAPGGPWP